MYAVLSSASFKRVIIVECYHHVALGFSPDTVCDDCEVCYYCLLCLLQSTMLDSVHSILTTSIMCLKM